MATAHKPERDFCASCGFPIRGHRCEACGRGREPLPVEEGRRVEVHVESEGGDNAGLDRAFEAFRNQDLSRFVGHVITADGGTTARSIPLPDGPGWIAIIRGAPVFTSIHTEAGELTVEAPVARVPRAQRVPVLRLALELAAQDLVATRLCLRDDLVLLRFSGRLDAQTPLTVRHVLREIGALAARFTELFAVSFDARPVIAEDQRSTVGFDALGQPKRLRFGPGTNRNAVTPAAKGAAQAARKVPAAAPPPPSGSVQPTSKMPAINSSRPNNPPADKPTVSLAAQATPNAAPPKSPATTPSAAAAAAALANKGPDTTRTSSIPMIPPNPVPKPITRPISVPPPPPLLLDDEPTVPTRIPAITIPESAAMSLDPSDLRRAEATTTPIRRIANAPPIPTARTSDPGAAPRPLKPGELIAPKIADDPRHNPQTMPDPTRRIPAAPSSSPGGLIRTPSGAKPMLEFDAPSRRPSGAMPAVTGESALLPADRLAAMLRQAQTLASLTLDTRPSLMSWLVRATVFRSVFEYRDALPDAVAQLYRCTGIGRDSAEPALLVMERIAVARCQVPPEKALTIEPFTSAPQAKEHVSRYISEIERSPSDPAFRHFLALGALSELLVRAKLPAQTEQRLREIVTFAQREGPKTSAFDLMMTSLQRISGG